MAADQNGLSDDERAELEQLRADKRAREEAAKAAQERAELEQLRAEQAAHAQEQERDRRIEQARRTMEPDEDLSMPLPQKIVLGICAVLLVAAIFYIVTAPK